MLTHNYFGENPLFDLLDDYFQRVRQKNMFILGPPTGDLRLVVNCSKVTTFYYNLLQITTISGAGAVKN